MRSIAHAIERLALLPLVGGALLLLFTGLANINIYRPWDFSFRAGHLAAAWVTMGALAVHIGAKWATTRDALRRQTPRTAAPEQEGLTRRGLLGVAFGTAALVGLLTAGQTVRPARPPRRPRAAPAGHRPAGLPGQPHRGIGSPGGGRPLDLPAGHRWR